MTYYITCLLLLKPLRNLCARRLKDSVADVTAFALHNIDIERKLSKALQAAAQGNTYSSSVLMHQCCVQHPMQHLLKGSAYSNSAESIQA